MDKNIAVFNSFPDFLNYSTNCLKLILDEKMKQKTHSIVQRSEQPTTVPLFPTEPEVEESHHFGECMAHLKSFNQTMLFDVILELTNSSFINNSNKTRGQGSVEPDYLFGNEWYVVWIWSTLFLSMVLFAIFGNSLIIWIILRQKIMRTVINVFLLNLTISDLLTCSFNATFNFAFMLTGHWPFTYTYCLVNNFINNLAIASSVCLNFYLEI